MAAARNVVYLHSHDTGRCVSSYGFPADTPHLQALADRGVTFRHAFCANPTCSPSRACLLSGQAAHTNGMMGLAHLGGTLTEPSRTLPTLLRDAGWDTVLAGLQHVVRTGGGDTMEEIGYTRVLGSARQGGDHAARDAGVAAGAAAFLRERGASADPEPFFLDVGFFLTHRTPAPGAPPEAEQWHNGAASPLGDPHHAAVFPHLPDTAGARADAADFAAAVTRLDARVGEVLDALDAAGLRDETLVIATTDHGPAFPGMKCGLTARGTGVMLLLAGPGGPGGPGGYAGGVAVDALASHVDLLPTVCEAVGLDAPAWAQGRSLSPAVADPANPTAVRGAVYAEVNHHAAYEPKRSVRTPAFSHQRRLDPGRPPHPVWPNTDASPTKTLLHAAGRLHAAEPDEELYDLVADPMETVNLAGVAAHAETLERMRGLLDGWMRETGDPALAGPPRVPGMKQTPKDLYSAGERWREEPGEPRTARLQAE